MCDSHTDKSCMCMATLNPNGMFLLPG